MSVSNIKLMSVITYYTFFYKCFDSWCICVYRKWIVGNEVYDTFKSIIMF